MEENRSTHSSSNMQKEQLESARNVELENNSGVIQVLPERIPGTAFTSPKTNPILAPETWDRIFREFHSTDFISVINSAPEWNHLLSSRKTLELFPHVLPFIMEFLPKNDFLQLRLVCRAWKRGLDSVYENHPSRLASVDSSLFFPTPDEEGKIRPEIDMGVKFQTLDSLQRFTTSMNLDSDNPFPGRCVWLKLHREEPLPEHRFERGDPIIEPEYWASVDSLLTQFGFHIWYLQLDVLVDLDADVEAQLRHMFHLVPNLRRLDLELQTEDNYCFKDEAWSCFNDHVIASLLAEPPSKLDKLEVFSAFFTGIYADGQIYPVILQLVRSYCVEGNLKRLGLCDITYNEPIPFPELLELCATLDFNVGPDLKTASPKLEKLTVKFSGRNCNISSVFDVLHHFAETLKDLTIDWIVVSMNESQKNYKIELPKLERLCFNYFSPNHHLFALKSLKYLRIGECRMMEKGEMYDADLFEQLPKLGKIVHKIDLRRKGRVEIRPNVK